MQTQRRRAQVVRRELAPAEEPRTKADWSFHNRYELYRDRCRTTGRLAALTLAFAALVLFRVLEPFQRLSQDIVGQTAAISALEEAHAAATQRAQRLARATRAFESVTELLDAAPWHAEAAELAREVAHLGRAYQRLVGASAAELEQAVLELERTQPARVGTADRVKASAASFQWARPPEPPLSPRRKVEPEGPLLSEEELRAIEDFAEARRRLEQLGLPAPSGSPDAPPPSSTPRPASIAEALETLGIDPTRIAALASVRERDEFAFAALCARANGAADATLRALLDLGRLTVVQPLHAASTEVGRLSAAKSLETFDSELGAWAARTQTADLPNRLASDPSQALGLADSFDHVIARLAPALHDEAAALGAEWEASQAHALGLGQELELASGALAESERRCAALVPAWLSNVTHPAQLIQVYPSALLVLLALVAYCAFLARESFIGMLHSHPGSVVLAEVRSTSSPWTLVRRGSLQNSITLCLYLGSLLLVWLAFERGTVLAANWVGLPHSEPWPFTARFIAAAPWFGRAAFLAAAGGLVLTLFADDPVPRRALRRV